MNEGNDNLEYIINYFKKNNNKEQLEIYESMKKEYNTRGILYMYY